jgi:hypothetical protein
MANDVDPVGEPNVAPDAFCTANVAPLGADDAANTAKTAVRRVRIPSSAKGIRLRRGARPT